MDETDKSPAPADAAPAAVPPERFRLDPIPILIVFVLGMGILFLSAITVEIVKFVVKLPERPLMPWIVLYYGHFVQLAYSLVAIYIVKRFWPADYGLHLPKGKSYVGAAVLWGLFFGVLMTVVDYWPQLLAHQPPEQPYPLTTINMAGWFSFEGVFVGPSEEVLFRGLLVTYLAHAMPGRISWRGYSMNGAGIVVAALFALAHIGSFFIRPFPMAFGQLLYAFVLGVFYAYWFEKSRSLLAPIIGHNVGDLVEYGFIFAMVAYWQ
jgi:uncharacterized protein